MPIVLILICAWLVVALFALLICAAARRTDREIDSADLAPVIDFTSALARKHVA
jgi:hypothetical protein